VERVKKIAPFAKGIGVITEKTTRRKGGRRKGQSRMRKFEKGTGLAESTQGLKKGECWGRHCTRYVIGYSSPVLEGGRRSRLKALRLRKFRYRGGAQKTAFRQILGGIGGGGRRAQVPKAQDTATKNRKKQSGGDRPWRCGKNPRRKGDGKEDRTCTIH